MRWNCISCPRRRLISRNKEGKSRKDPPEIQTNKGNRKEIPTTLIGRDEKFHPRITCRENMNEFMFKLFECMSSHKKTIMGWLDRMLNFSLLCSFIPSSGVTCIFSCRKCFHPMPTKITLLVHLRRSLKNLSQSIEFQNWEREKNSLWWPEARERDLIHLKDVLKGRMACGWAVCPWASCSTSLGQCVHL